MASEYNPVQTVAPNTGSGDNYLSIRANPEAFGASIGQAVGGLGKTIQGIGDEQAQIALQKQGMLNETLATNGETEATSQYGDINAEYRNKKGLAAVDAYPEYQAKIKAVRQQVRKTIPNPAAQRAFDLLVQRREGFMLENLGLYKAQEEKTANIHSATASLEQSVSQSADLDIATNDVQFGDHLANIKFQLQRLVSTAEFGVDDKDNTLAKKIGMKQDPKTGDVTFDTSTDLGKHASEIYQEYYDKYVGQAWKNRIEAIADNPVNSDVKAAVDLLQKNDKDIPASIKAQLYKELDGPYRSEITRQDADDISKGVDKDWEKTQTTVSPLAPPTGTRSESTPTYTPSQITSPAQLLPNFKIQEGGPPGNVYQIQKGTPDKPKAWDQFANKDEKIDNPEDNERVASRILEQYIKDYHGDLARVAVAYFSGTGNVAPPESRTPYINNKSDGHKTVSQYVADVLDRQQRLTAGYQGAQRASNEVPSTTQGPGTGTLEPGRTVPPPTKAEYYDEHFGEILKKANDLADSKGYDNRQRDELIAHVTQKFNREIQIERDHTTAASNLVRRFAFGDNANQPMISTLNELEKGPKEVQEAWKWMQSHDPNGAQAFKTRVLTANSKGRQGTYGTQWWEHFNDVISGKITNLNDLYKVVGPDRNSSLTNTGMSMIAKEWAIAHPDGVHVDPQGEAFLHSEQAYFRQMRIDMVGGENRHNANGERVFQRAVMQALPMIQAARANGAGAEMFDKDDTNYIGGSERFETRNLATILNDMIMTQNPVSMGNLLPPEQIKNKFIFDPKSLDSAQSAEEAAGILQKQLKDRKLTPEEMKPLEEYFTKRNWLGQK